MSTTIGFKDTLSSLVSTDIDDAYEGTAVNDRTLGRMFFLKKYEKAAAALYEKFRETLSPPIAIEKQAFANDGKFIATAQQREGLKRVDAQTLHNELTEVFVRMQELEGREPNRTRAVIDAGLLIDKCTTCGNDVTMISVIEAKP